MSIGKICSRTIHLAELNESAQVAANRMKNENVGTLLILDAVKRPIGILTDRDIAVRVVAQGLDAEETTVEQVMTAHPRWVGSKAPIEDAIAIMRSLAVRRLPVVDKQERLVGIVTVDDVLELVTNELEDLGKLVGMSHPGITVPATRPLPNQV